MNHFLVSKIFTKHFPNTFTYAFMGSIQKPQKLMDLNKPIESILIQVLIVFKAKEGLYKNREIQKHGTKHSKFQVLKKLNSIDLPYADFDEPSKLLSPFLTTPMYFVDARK